MAQASGIKIRMENAEANFVEFVQITTGCMKSAAYKVMDLYLKEGTAKFDIETGTIKVNHEAYLEKDVLVNTILMMVKKA